MVIDIVLSVHLFCMAIAVLVTIHICLSGRAFRRGAYNITTNTNVVQRSSSRTLNMSLDDIKKLRSFDYKVEEEEEKGKSSQMERAVCLESFKVGEMCRLLPNCQHSFHAHCIDSWLSETAVCPVCRSDANLVNTGEQSRSSGEVVLNRYREIRTVNWEFPKIDADAVSVKVSVSKVAVSVILLFAAVAVMVTIHACIVTRAFRRGGFDINPANIVGRLSGSRRPNMSSDDIGKLSSFDYKLEEKRAKSSHMECAICLESFKEGEMCRLLPNCQHSFHAECIDSWLSKAAICLICRTDANLVNTGDQTKNSGEVGVDYV